ncbi:hypothetical protein P171DRAFT_470493 [Karstenula rhodostoma CBS 690.94]|uniref:Uncharacterized protein n=1 Tax=Karstenula rhodostoma CBS 690.94 TaxID=1392251 RepID=A0A9P4PPC9_9PLEO|nr:hypothetical protein P171DRAFT_470493 [Karstenula rhodostoma CBS 690.94]
MFSVSKLFRSPGPRVWINTAFVPCRTIVRRQLHNPPSISERAQTSDEATSSTLPGLRTHLKTLTSTEFQPLEGKFNWQSKPSYVSSFNADLDKKTIYVPGSPPKWNVVDVPFTYKTPSSRLKDSELVESLELREVQPSRYFAALRHLCPSYDYSRVHIDCDWEVLESLCYIFPFASEKPNGTYGHRLLALERLPATFTLHMVSNTLFIRRRPAPDVSSEQKAKMYLQDFMPRATTSYPDIPASARSIYSVEYELGPFRCVVHFSPHAWSHAEDVPRDTQPALEAHGAPETAKQTDSQSPVRIFQAGKGVPLSDLMLVQAVPDGKGVEDFKWRSKKDALASVNKIERQKRRKAGPKLRSRVFFSRIPTTYRVTLRAEMEKGRVARVAEHPISETKLCKSVTPHKNDLTPSEEEIEPLCRMFSLLNTLRDVTKSTKNNACVLELSNGDDQDECLIDMWEPDFDEEVSGADEVPEQLRVPRKLVSDEDYQQFWVANGGAASKESV